jgi:hypothetical protein
VAASETPANPFGSTLIALARAIERLYEILQHPAVQTAYGQAADQPADNAPVAAMSGGPAGLGEPAATEEPAEAALPLAGPDGPGPPPARSRGREPATPPPAPSAIPPPVGERARRSIPQDVKIAVSARDGGRCRQCGSTVQLHFDHVIPISRGGANTVANIQLLCGACNRAKGAKLKLPSSRG